MGCATETIPATNANVNIRSLIDRNVICCYNGYSGSGVLLDSHTVITAGHLFEIPGDSEVKALLFKYRVWDNWPTSDWEDVCLIKALPYPENNITVNLDKDWALIKTETQLQSIERIQLVPKSLVYSEITLPVILVSNPQMETNVVYYGKIAKTCVFIHENNTTKKFIQLDISGTTGSSGGGVYDYFGRLLGICVREDEHGQMYVLPWWEIDALKSYE